MMAQVSGTEGHSITRIAMTSSFAVSKSGSVSRAVASEDDSSQELSIDLKTGLSYVSTAILALGGWGPNETANASRRQC